MVKYQARTERFNEAKLHTVYEVDGDLEVAVWEGRTIDEARGYAAARQSEADRSRTA